MKKYIFLNYIKNRGKRVIIKKKKGLPDESPREEKEMVDRRGRQCYRDLLGTWHGVVECPEQLEIQISAICFI